ncbi:leucine-rich repeat transmembrane protein kinase family protein [Actinidia rufa]|uniref:Leucine-rich repeat transmembrane protein kinase family protein n=1 Tax=Actinidia rufa TaxID=165716 RepID=A0A7J0FLR6_9ERIC|nr:leucine-rich repeat transmembrane protein kinase family protein [Actinidia rufa]
MEISTPSLFFFLASMFIASVLATDPFSQSLLSLKSELIINDPKTLSDWFVPSEPNPPDKIYACSWSGVTCDKNFTKVIALDLSMNNLGGVLSGDQFKIFTSLVDLNLSYNSFSEKFPTGVFNLTNLRSLDVSRNNFSGQFPNGVSNLSHLVVLDAFSNSFSGPLPAEISQLQFLKVLNLAGSYFSGPIPSEYGSFKSLEFIHLAGNFLTGQVPPELGQITTLTHMEIGYNSYEGTIPWQFGNMSELQYLDVAGANLSGSIPNQLSNLTKLESLFLFRNQLTGLVPGEFSRITVLTSLDLSDNQLSGPIPETFAELKNLRLLSLMYNNMNGTVPEGIANLPSLDTLLIWNNFFHGSLPETLGKYSKLKWVDVSTNNFVGTIPPDICSGGELFKLILFSNGFTGGLSPSLANCSSLFRLRIENNSFTGEIPLKFSDLPQIAYVDLSRNRFTGGIPNDISQASKLEYFNVSYNPELGGLVPAETWSLSLLQNFSASSCNITGDLPPFGLCKSLSVIELSTNSLSGTVPRSISNCQVLERIDLANNNFTGHLPEELASLPSLAVVDFAHNSFNGQIPTKFANSSSLLLLNVSFNDISGPIPSEMRFRLMGESAFVGNRELCGAPLQPCPRTSKIPSGLQLGINKTQKFAWVLIICAVVVLCITVSIVGIFYFRRGSGGQWRMVSFIGLPQFTATDVLRSLSSTEVIETVPTLSGSVCKAVMPTGITVSVKKIEVDAKKMNGVSESVSRLGNARHKNLLRLLGFCHNQNLAYLLYDYLPNGNLAEKIKVKRDWAAKYKIVIGIARGLGFLHHDRYPAIPHGDLRASNVVFDENMEPHLAEFGLKFLGKSKNNPFSAANSRIETGEYNNAVKEELYMDVYNFGEIILEVLTNGRLANAGGSIHGKPTETLLSEICHENEVGSSDSVRDEIKVVLEVALLCIKSRPCDRLSMEEVLKLLSALKPQTK